MDDQVAIPDGGGPSPTAYEVLAEVGRVRRRTRMTLADGAWRYLMVWALVFLGAWVSSFFSFAQWYWLVGLPAGWIGMFLMYRGIEPAAGKRDALYWTGGLGIGVLNLVAGFVLPDELVVVTIWVVIGLGFAFFGWLDRQPAAVALFTGLAIMSAVLGVIVEDRFELYSVLALAFTLASGGAALALWWWARRHGAVQG